MCVRLLTYKQETWLTQTDRKNLRSGTLSQTAIFTARRYASAVYATAPNEATGRRNLQLPTNNSLKGE